MLIPVTSIKSIAKMLLILMMGGSGGPSSSSSSSSISFAPAPTPALQYSKDFLLACRPVLDQCPQQTGYYQMTFNGIDYTAYFSQRQLESIVNSMNDDVYTATFNRPGTNYWHALANYIVQQDLLAMGMPNLPITQLYGEFLTTQSPTAQLPGYAPPISLYTGLNNFMSEHGMYAHMGATTGSQQTAAHKEQMMQTKTIKVSSADIAHYQQTGNIKQLVNIRQQLLTWQKEWMLSKESHKKIEQLLEETEYAIVDLGHLLYPRLWNHSKTLQTGNIQGLDIRYDFVCDLLKNRNSIIGGIQCYRHGGERMLWIEKYYLEKVLTSPLVKHLLIVQTGDTVEAQTSFDIVRNTYNTELTEAERAYYYQCLSLYPIATAEAIVARRSDADHINRVVPQTTHTASSSSSATSTATHASTFDTTAAAPTTTAATAPGITTTTYAQSPLVADQDAGIIFDSQPLPTSSRMSDSMALDSVLLDMVTTTPSQDPEYAALHALTCEFFNEIMSQEPLFFDALSTEVLIDRAAQYELEYNQQLAVAKEEAKEANLHRELRLIAELKERIQAESPKNWAGFFEHSNGFMTRIRDVRGMATDLTHFAVEVTDLCVDTLMHLILHSKQRADNPLAQATVHKSAKIFKLLDALNVKNMEQFCRNLDALTPQQRAHLLGTIMADTVTLMGIARIPGTIGRVFNGISNIQSEGVIGRSLQQATKSVSQKVERLRVLAEDLSLTHAPETIATTAEGLEVPVTTAVEETMSLRNAEQKIGGAAKEAVKDTKLTQHNVKQPDFIKYNRVPIDRETILRSGGFQKTNTEVKGARVYKKDGKFYHRDTLHKGEGAHLEVYNKNGQHIGIADPLTGELIPDTAIKGRTLYE